MFATLSIVHNRAGNKLLFWLRPATDNGATGHAETIAGTIGHECADNQVTLQDNGNETAQSIGFLLLNEFSLLAFASAIEPLRSANRQSGRELYQWVIASLMGPGSGQQWRRGGNGWRPVSPSGMSDGFVCAGVNVRENTDRNILNLVRRLDRKALVIGAICTGTYVMAAAGLLGDRRCASTGKILTG